MRYDHFSLLPERAFQPLGRRMTLEGGGKGSQPAAPDYSGIASANAQAALYSKQAADNDLAFRKQQYADSQPQQQRLMDLAGQVAQQQLGSSQQADARSSQQWNDYMTTYQPLEHQMVNEAQNYGSEADQAQQAGVATADVRSQSANSRAQGARGLASMGVNPNSGRYAAMSQQNDVMESAQAAGAATNARTVARDKGISLRAGAASFGRNMPNTSGQMMGLATQAGSSAVGNQNTGFMSGLPYAQYQSGATGNMLGAAGIQQQGALGMGGLMNQSYATAMSGYNANQGLDLGGLMAGGAKLYTAFGSDRRLKMNISLIGQDERTGLNLYEFNYIDAPSTRYRGVMADEVEKKYPEAVIYGNDGYARVRYDLLGIEMVEVEA